MLQDALKKALSGESKLQARDPAAGAPDGPAPGPALPDPADSDWVKLLPRAPRGASIGRLQQETAAVLKELKASGRKREAQALAKARDSFLKVREKAAWKATKTRWGELGFSDKLYRRLKQENANIERIVTRLHTRRAETMRGEGQEAVHAWLTGS